MSGAQVMIPQKVANGERDCHRNIAVPIARRLANDHPATNEFGALLRWMESHQIIRSDERRGSHSPNITFAGCHAEYDWANASPVRHV